MIFTRTILFLGLILITSSSYATLGVAVGNESTYDIKTGQITVTGMTGVAADSQVTPIEDVRYKADDSTTVEVVTAGSKVAFVASPGGERRIVGDALKAMMSSRQQFVVLIPSYRAAEFGRWFATAEELKIVFPNGAVVGIADIAKFDVRAGVAIVTLESHTTYK